MTIWSTSATRRDERSDASAEPSNASLDAGATAAPASVAGSPAGGVVPRRLSASALERYRTCPKQFWFAQIEKAPYDKDPGPQLAQGNAVHHALERLMGLPMDERTPENAERALRAVWCEHRRPGTFVSRDEEAAYGLEAVEMVRRFASGDDVDVEPLAREQWLTRRLANGVVLIGKLDRIDPRPGGVAICDYKTGKRQLDEDELRDELAAIVYLLLAEQAVGEPVERLRLHYLRSGDKIDWCPEREDIEERERWLLELTSEILEQQDWPADPGFHCRWCPFALRCPERQAVELAELVPVEGLPF